MCAWVSQTQGRYNTIFWLNIVLLSSLDLKIPKAVKKLFKQPLEFVSQSIMGDTVNGFEKK